MESLLPVAGLVEDGVGRALEGGRSRSHTLVQMAEASKQTWYKCRPACSCWGKSRPCNLLYYLGVDTHLVALAGKRAVLYDGGGSVLYRRQKGRLGMGKRVCF